MTTYSDRTTLELQKFERALDSLKEVAVESETKIVRDSLLLRFVYTFETAWQSMRRVLQDRGDTETPRVAFATLETAFKVGMIQDPDLWKRLREARNGVSHAYDEAMAVALAALVRRDGIPTFQALLASLKDGR